MPDNIIHSDSQPQQSSQVQPTSKDPHVAGLQAAANTNKKQFSVDTKISSVGDLRSEAPEVYQKMMEGLAFGIIRKMRRSMERIKKQLREAQEER